MGHPRLMSSKVDGGPQRERSFDSSFGKPRSRSGFRLRALTPARLPIPFRKERGTDGARKSGAVWGPRAPAALTPAKRLKLRMAGRGVIIC